MQRDWCNRGIPCILALAMAAGPACSARPAPVVAAAPPASHASTEPASRAIRELRTNLARVFGAPIMSRAAWGVDIRSLDTGERLFALDADKLMMPASNMKIVTLATAAEVLGWDHRFTTTLESAAPIVDGVLAGDLFVRSTGDPTINRRSGRAAAVVAEWVDALRSAGIAQIDGRIVGDDQAFDDQWLGSGWAWDYLQYGYAAPAGALQFNENIAQLTVSPGAVAGAPATAELSPGAGLTVLNRAVTLAEGSEDIIEYRRRLDRAVLEVTGGVAAGSAPVQRNVAVVNPTVFFARSLKDALEAAGVRTTGEAVDFDEIAPGIAAGPVERRVITTTRSPSLQEIATVLMKVSQNLYAETLVKAVGASRRGLGTTAAGRSAMADTLGAWGIPPDAYVLADGSGLSRYNYVTAATLTAILERMYRDVRHRNSFTATLPIAGQDGTLATRMRRSLAEGNALAKTGSIANVRTLSGYVRTRDGEMLVFSVLANDFVIPATTVTWIADLAVEILANFTRH